MTIKQFIEKAIEGGWKMEHYTGRLPLTQEEIKSVIEIYEQRLAETHEGYLLLNPEAWKAVGKVEGWFEIENPITNHEPDWLIHMHRMIDVLAHGKTIEQYLETL